MSDARVGCAYTPGGFAAAADGSYSPLYNEPAAAATERQRKKERQMRQPAAQAATAAAAANSSNSKRPSHQEINKQ